MDIARVLIVPVYKEVINPERVIPIIYEVIYAALTYRREIDLTGWQWLSPEEVGMALVQMQLPKLTKTKIGLIRLTKETLVSLANSIGNRMLRENTICV